MALAWKRLLFDLPTVWRARQQLSCDAAFLALTEIGCFPSDELLRSFSRPMADSARPPVLVQELVERVARGGRQSRGNLLAGLVGELQRGSAVRGFAEVRKLGLDMAADRGGELAVQLAAGVVGDELPLAAGCLGG